MYPNRSARRPGCMARLWRGDRIRKITPRMLFFSGLVLLTFVTLVKCEVVLPPDRGDRQPEAQREPAVPLRSLLVLPEDMPSCLQLYAGPERVSGAEIWGEENLGVYFEGIGTREVASHQVWRFRNAVAAEFYRKRMVAEGLVIPKSRTTPGQVRDGWTYTSPIADFWDFTCQEYRWGSACYAMARYEEFCH